jgi:hypothetical protein
MTTTPSSTIGLIITASVVTTTTTTTIIIPIIATTTSTALPSPRITTAEHLAVRGAQGSRKAGGVLCFDAVG